MDWNYPIINRLLDEWLDEDIGHGDLTSPALKKTTVSAHWKAKEDGVFCGGPLIERLFERLDKSVHVTLLRKDGDHFQNNTRILELNGAPKYLVAGERTALNIAMHLSGIATETARLVAELEGTGIRLADTRKTTPGLRLLEKYAVRCGGGINHRFGLDDAAMLKENHLAWSQGIASAIQAIRKHAPFTAKVIVEVETSVQAEEAIRAGADGILLDEIPPLALHALVPELRDLAANRRANQGSNQIILEASGVNPSNLKAYADTGIDLISTSAPITKSSWIDFSMRFD